jgi:hypothetical protein
MEPSTTRNEKINTIGDLFSNFIDNAAIVKNGRLIFAIRQDAKHAYKKIEKLALECISRNTSDKNLDCMIEVLGYVMSNSNNSYGSGFDAALIALPDKVKRVIDQGYITTRDIKAIMIDSFTFEIVNDVRARDVNNIEQEVPDIIFTKLDEVVEDMRDVFREKERIVITEQHKKIFKVRTIAKLIHKIISKSPISQKFLADIRQEYDGIEEPMLELMSSNATNQNLDDIIKVFSDIKHKSSQAMISFYINLNKIVELGYVTTQDISYIITSLIRENDPNHPSTFARASELKSVISDFKNNNVSGIMML